MPSCPVCYETFATEDDKLLPFQLPCGDIICSGCISNDIFESSYFCPECGNECKGDSPEAIGSLVILEKDNTILEEEDYFTGRDTECSDDIFLPEARDSLFAQFTKRTSTGGGLTPPSTTPSPAISPAVSDKKPGRKGFGDRYGVCKYPSCKNKACGNDGHCFNHSSNKKQHLVQEDKLANLLARTSLDFVQINSGVQSGFKPKFQSRAEDWPHVNPAELMERFKRQERMELGEAMALINRARDILSREANVLKLEAPVIAVGDLHGQYYDLVNMLNVGGDPVTSESEYMFLGDYVDRGSFSCEVMLTLLAYKVACPDKIWLIRGNHECASVSGHFGFKEECKRKYGVQLYYRFLLLFQTMPLAALISTAYGDIFACHGGLSPDILTIEELDAIDRFVEPEENSALLDILWSDPISEERVDEMTDAEYEDFISLEWRPNPTRGCSYCYGYKAVHDFLNRNSIVSLVRAHEVQENGFHKHFDPAMIESRIQQSAKYKRKMSSSVATMRRLTASEQKAFKDECPAEEWHYPSHDIPTVITVFSAPNYCDRYDNQGAILKIAMGLDGFQFLQYSCVPHPVPDVIESQMNNQIMSVIQTCPYMPTSFRDFVRVAIELGHEDSLIEEGNEDEEDEEDEEDGDDQDQDVAGDVFNNNSDDDSSMQGRHRSDALTPPLLPVNTSRKAISTPPKQSSLNKLFQPVGTPPELDTDTDTDTADEVTRIDTSNLALRANNVPFTSSPESTSTSKSKSRSPPPIITRASSQSLPSPDEMRFPVMTSPMRATPSYQRNSSMPSVSPPKATTVSARVDSSPPRKQHSSDCCASEGGPPSMVSSSPMKRSGSIKSNFRRATEVFNGGAHHPLHSSSYSLAHASDAINELHPVRVKKYMDNFVKSNNLHWNEKPDPQQRKKSSMESDEDAGFQKRISYLTEQFDKQAEINTNKFIVEDRQRQSFDSLMSRPGPRRSASLNFTPSSPTSGGGRAAGTGSGSGSMASPGAGSSSQQQNMRRKKSMTKLGKDLMRSGSGTGGSLETEEDEEALFKEVSFTKTEVLALRLLFSLFDRSGTATIGYEDLVAYGEETGGLAGIRDAADALAIVDIDGDGMIGLLDFIHFAARLRDQELAAGKDEGGS